MLVTRSSTLKTVATLLAISVATPLLGSGAQAAILLGHWKLNETSSGTAADSSGNGLNGTYLGGVNPNVAGAPGFGSGADFDGSTGEVALGAGFTNGLGNLTNNFSVMAWINLDQLASKNRIIGAHPNAAWGFGTAGNDIQLTTFGVKDYTGATTLLTGVWTHVAAVMDTHNQSLKERLKRSFSVSFSFSVSVSGGVVVGWADLVMVAPWSS